MTLLSEGATSPSWQCQCLFLFFPNQEKEKIVVKLMQTSEAALALQLPAKECSVGVEAASFPCVGKGNLLPCSRAQAFPREGRFVPLYRNTFCYGGGWGAAFPDPDSSKTNSWVDCWLVKKGVLTTPPSHSPLEQVPKLLGAASSVLHLEKPCSDMGICAFPSCSWIN